MGIVFFYRGTIFKTSIFLLTFLAVRFGICKLPGDLNWKSITGVGFLGGIGFTMSIFITLLAFDNETIINNAKFVILISSLTAGLIGFLSLKLTLKPAAINNG